MASSRTLPHLWEVVERLALQLRTWQRRKPKSLKSGNTHSLSAHPHLELHHLRQPPSRKSPFQHRRPHLLPPLRRRALLSMRVGSGRHRELGRSLKSWGSISDLCEGQGAREPFTKRMFELVRLEQPQLAQPPPQRSSPLRMPRKSPKRKISLSKRSLALETLVGSLPTTFSKPPGNSRNHPGLHQVPRWPPLRRLLEVHFQKQQSL
mmetsp:Transcript_3276/g.6142  ORF Transcript_3276/g.6142 Transcript_3276/m.6142 type:complete len:207 (+) Transcript_3276:667-1287(+)